jgi:hypothetical protein
MYSVTVITTLTGGVGLGAAGRIELRSDAGNPPVTVRASGGGSLTSIPNTVPAGEVINTATQFELTYVVPAGDFVVLASVPGQDTPVFSIEFATEIPIG